jgi:hypothetical protein
MMASFGERAFGVAQARPRTVSTVMGDVADFMNAQLRA